MQLAKAAKLLRNTAPEEFDNFAASFNEYAATIMQKVLESDASSILNSQGQAQMCVQIRRILEEAKNNKPTP